VGHSWHMSTSTESMRWDLLESLERCYYTGSTAGQPWLGNLSAFVHGLPRNDRRLIRLAIVGKAADLGAFIALSPPSTAEKLQPSSWLDGYVDWSAGLS
jgi:hypothetical protein